MEIPAPALLALLVALPMVLGARLARVAWRDWRERRAHTRRRVVAERAEKEAWALLEAQGYRVLAEQLEGGWTLEVDGEPLEVDLRADYLVVDGRGRRFVAEVKSGRRAPRPEHGATRRQLLEYRVAFAPDIAGVLLVDMARPPDPADPLWLAGGGPRGTIPRSGLGLGSGRGRGGLAAGRGVGTIATSSFARERRRGGRTHQSCGGALISVSWRRARKGRPRV